MKINKKGIWIFQCLAGLVILILAIIYFDFHTVWIKIKSADVRFIIPAFSFGFLTIVIAAIKLKVCLGYISSVPFYRTLLAILNGKVFGYFAPGTLGADLSIILSLRSSKNSIYNIGSVILVDRVLSLISIILLMLLLLPITYNRLPVSLQHFFVTMAFTGCVFAVIITISYFFSPVFFRNMLSGKLLLLSSHPLTRIPMLVFFKWRRSLLVITIGLLLNVCIQSCTYFLLHALHLRVDLLYVIGVLPINSFLIMIPVSIMGIGLREGGFYYLLSVFSITMEDVIAFNMIGYFFEIVIIIIAGTTMVVKVLANLTNSKNSIVR